MCLGLITHELCQWPTRGIVLEQVALVPPHVLGARVDLHGQLAVESRDLGLSALRGFALTRGGGVGEFDRTRPCLLYTSPSPRD